MNTRNSILASITAPLCLLAAVANADPYTVHQIEDGDTLVILMDNKPERVQLLGIDAPEDTLNPKLTRDMQRTGLDEQTLLNLGNAATDHLKSLIVPDQQVALTGDLKKRDKYGRISLIISHAGDRSLNEAMVADGYAIVLQRQPLEASFKALLTQHEAEAIAERSGLWKKYYTDFMNWSGR